MAKPKKDKDTSEKIILNAVDQLDKEIREEFGDGVFVGSSSIKERHKTTIGISPVINRLLGGGITSGSWGTFTGKPKAGKTTTALHAAAKAQRIENGYLDKISNILIPRNVYFIDAEGRIKERDFSIPGLIITPDRFRIVTSSEDSILSAEKFLNIVDKIIHTDRGAFIIIDSISCLAEEKRLNEFGAQTRGGQAKIVSDFCSRNATVVPIRDHILICITHIISNTSGYGAPTVEKTPNSLLYQIDFKLKVTKDEEWSLSDDEDPIGKIVHWKCECSGLRGPGRKGKSYIRFGDGIDEIQEYIQYGIDYGIIDKAKSWYTLELEGFDMIKSQGVEKIRDVLLENPNLYNKLIEEVNLVLT